MEIWCPDLEANSQIKKKKQVFGEKEVKDY
jgi:hypothetical protein